MKILAGLILHNPDIMRLKKCIESIKYQIDRMVIIDNHSDNRQAILEILEKSERFSFIKNDCNQGIAYALNQIFACAEREGYAWVITLDQDSICPGNMIKRYKNFIHLDGVGILSPLIIDENVNTIIGKKTKGKELTILKNCITSGSLTKTAVWKECGKFDEVLFIDCVDFDFCNRVKQCGYKILRINDVVLRHEIGKARQHYFFCFKVMVFNHNTLRKYFIARNIVYLVKKKEKHGKIKIMLREGKQMLFVLLYEKEKWKKIKAIIKGIQDGFRLAKANNDGETICIPKL